MLAPLTNGNPTAGISALIKIPPILADIGIGLTLYLLVKRWRGIRRAAVRLALIAAAIYVFNPVSIYDSAIWGQTDSVGTLVLLVMVAALIRGNAEGATALAVIAALIKPQFGVVALPVVGVVLLRRHLLRAGEMPRHPVLMPQRVRGWFEEERGIWRLVSSAVVGLGLMVLLLLPFSLDIPGFVRQMAGTAAGYPYLTVNAYNPWALIGAGGTPPYFVSGLWSADNVPLLGPIPGVMIGGVVLAIGFGLGALRLAWLDDRRSILLVTLLLALAFFMLPTRVHERYMFPIFAILPLLAVANRRWQVATVVLSIAAFINMHGVLTTPLYATPNLETLPLGALFRQPLGILTSIGLHVAGFAFIAWMIRPAAAAEADAFETVPEDGPTLEDAGITPAPVPLLPSDCAPPPGVEAASDIPARRWWAPLAGLVPHNSVRRDRSALLIGEIGGRLNRRDLLIVVVVFVSALLLRGYRLEVPYSMHFDEVYHARTAVEFLQHWRYDITHSIYEFTHPHLAKYAMALGIEAVGNNRVVAQGDLGTPVADAAIEIRWNPSGQPNTRNGDRLYVATGQQVRAYDLANLTAAQPITVPGAFVAVAVDEASHTLFVGQADGSVVQLPTDELDYLRSVPTDADPPATLPFASMSGLEGELEQLEVVGDHLVGRSSGGTLVSVDLATAREVGRTQIDGAAAMTTAPARSVLVADPELVSDPAEAADTLADLLGLDPFEVETQIVEADAPVAIAGYMGDVGDDVQAQIDEGTLEGFSISDGDAVAVGTSDGVALLDVASLGELAFVDTGAQVTGLALISDGPEHPTLYAATGDRLSTIRVPNDQPPVLGPNVQMPNVVSDVFWNEATTMVHVLGTSQDGAATTVYVVEPRSDSVFADARLDFVPQAVVMDVQPDRPAEDRNDLLSLGGDGRTQIVDTGNNQFAYRLPGVILGALTAALIFLLGRFLFRRQSVAVIAALLVLADGMFFANSRIAMNDVYVTFFIVAAMTLFVPLWLGRWRSRPQIVVGILGVGLLLGLALSSKWVGAYAIGAVGLLLLLRSALGRMIALGAMIAMTGVLGYIAITPNPDVENPQLNYIFLLIMTALTVLLAVGITLRPVRLTRDELRLAIVAPLLLGAGALTFGAYRLVAATADEASATPMRALLAGLVLIAFGVGLFVAARAAASRGRGPWADPALIDPDREPAAPPPPRGWLRPGSGLLGLPWFAALVAITVLPLAIYVISYVPWIELGNRLTESWPVGNTGQTFIDLQRSMYDYHNNLRATHAASSPWWAWPLDLKPVWFEQADYANSTTAVIYDTGNLVIFWLAIPAVAWLCWQAWKRRSLSLTFLAITIACLWLPWSRIDRATFQYHIFTTLPFSFLALAYFLGELWHGPSERTWRLARVGAGLAIIGAPLLWMLRLPLCSIANTEAVNPGTEVCAGLSRELVLTDFQMIGVALAIGGLAAAALLVYLALRPDPTGERQSPVRTLLFPISFAVALLGVVFVVIGAGLQGNPVFQTRVSAEEPALVALLLLSVPAYFVLRGTDPRRYVIGVIAAAAAFFVAFYPNIASLPVPTPLSQIHLGLLPTWNWGFQFAVNMDEPNRNSIDPFAVSLLTIAVACLCAAAVYAARSWQSLREETEDVSPLPETS